MIESFTTSLKFRPVH